MTERNCFRYIYLPSCTRKTTHPDKFSRLSSGLDSNPSRDSRLCLTCSFIDLSCQLAINCQILVKKLPFFEYELVRRDIENGRNPFAS